MFWLATFTFSLFPSPYSYFLERSATLRKRVADISFMLKKIGAFVCTTNILLRKNHKNVLASRFLRAFKLQYVLQVPNFSCHLYSTKISHAPSLLLIFSNPIFFKNILILLFIVREHLVFDVYKQTPKTLEWKKRN